MNTTQTTKGAETITTTEYQEVDFWAPAGINDEMNVVGCKLHDCIQTGEATGDLLLALCALRAVKEHVAAGIRKLVLHACNGDAAQADRIWGADHGDRPWETEGSWTY